MVRAIVGTPRRCTKTVTQTLSTLTADNRSDRDVDSSHPDDSNDHGAFSNQPSPSERSTTREGNSDTPHHTHAQATDDNEV